jgi:hypothetical protein
VRADAFVTNQAPGQRFRSRLVITRRAPLVIERAGSPDDSRTWCPPVGWNSRGCMRRGRGREGLSGRCP